MARSSWNGAAARLQEDQALWYPVTWWTGIYHIPFKATPRLHSSTCHQHAHIRQHYHSLLYFYYSPLSKADLRSSKLKLQGHH